MPDTHLVDARELEPPEPLVRVMEALSAMQPADRVKLLLYREPYPLYDILDRNGYAHSVTRHQDGTVEILIWNGAAESAG